MKNKILALVLAITIAFSVLPTAFAANIGSTTEKLKRTESFGKGKVISHVNDDVVYLKQALVELLDESMSYFKGPDYYYIGVWREAQQLYKDEVNRIYSLNSLKDLVVDSFFGYMPNETTMEVAMKIEGLSNLNKTIVKSNKDLKTISDEFKSDTLADIALMRRADYNDYYWDKIVDYKTQFLNDVAGIKTFSDYIEVENTWEYFFENDEIDFEDMDLEELLEYGMDFADFFDKEFYSKNELSSYTEFLEVGLYVMLDSLDEQGYDVYTDKVYTIIDNFVSSVGKIQYIEGISKEYNKTVSKLAAAVGFEVGGDREPATVSVKKRMQKRIDALYFSYNFRNYSDEMWGVMTEIYEDASSVVSAAEYKDQIDEKFYKSVAAEMKEIRTYAQQLKEEKAVAIEALREYLGNKKYNQTKVKALVNEGTKKINAATDLYDVYDICEAYLAKLEKTVNIYKITVSKSGKGAVTKTANVKYGSNFTVKIVPAAGYKIKSIVVDGKKVKLTNNYTFKKVVKAHTIKVTFGK